MMNIPLVQWQSPIWDVCSKQTSNAAHFHLQKVIRQKKDSRMILLYSSTPVTQSDGLALHSRSSEKKTKSKKLMPQFIGLFQVIKKVNQVSHRLELPPQYRTALSFGCSLVLLYSSLFFICTMNEINWA